MQYQQLLSQQFLSNTIPHAILINGAIGSGKRALAQWFVDLLTCQTRQSQLGTQQVSSTNEWHINACGQCKTCLLLNNKSYPDHLALELAGASIGIDDVRRANSFLEKTAHTGYFKTVLIPDAQTMTVAAANALLKTLEEPSPNSIIVLLSNDIELLLPTIVSRCRVLTMQGLVGELLVNQFNISNASDDGELDAYVNLSHLPELSDKDVSNLYQDFKQQYVTYITRENSNGENTLLKLIREQKHAVRWLEKITVNLLREQFSIELSENSAFKKTENYKKLNPETLNQLYKAIIAACKVLKLSPQANETFVLEKLYFSLDDIVTQSISS